jgi:hypothetical protein
MEMRVNIIAVLCFLFFWALSFIYLGIPDTYKMLGGSTGFYFLLPLVASLHFICRYFAKLLWSFICILIGLIATNYLYSYFYYYDFKSFKLLSIVYIIYAPISFIIMGFVCTIQSLVEFKKKEDISSLRYFSALIVALFAIPPLIIIPILDYLKNSIYIYNLGYQIALGTILAGGLIFLLDARKITLETLYYIAKPVHRFDVDRSKFKGVLIIGTLIFLICCTYWEIFYRNHWLIWSETVIIFSIYICMMFVFVRVIFIPAGSEIRRPKEVYLPSIKSKKTIIIAAIFLSFFLLALIISAWKTSI